MKDKNSGFTLIRTCFASRYIKLYRLLAEPCKGFTLIELIVVMGIVVLLSGVSLNLYKDVSRNNRDQIRIKHLTSIRQALESYKASKGTYPAVSADVNNPFSNLVPNYLEKEPKDPLSPGKDRKYWYRSYPLTYALCAKVENTNLLADSANARSQMVLCSSTLPPEEVDRPSCGSDGVITLACDMALPPI